MLIKRKCSKRIIEKNLKQLSLKEVYAPICCWPNEQEIFCFDTWTTKNKITKCYRPEPLLDSSLFIVKLIYFRCNTPYTVF
jgi:hypothetical protein